MRTLAIFLALCSVSYAGLEDAVVDLENGSGVIIVRGDEVAYGVSAAHCATRVDDEFKMTNTKGKWSFARWKAIDKSVDLALFVCHSRNVTGVAHVLGDLPSGPEWTAVGYPAGDGEDGQAPKKLQFDKVGKSYGMERNIFHVRRGYFGGGDSGGAVFAKHERSGVEGLVGVMTHGPLKDPGAWMSATTHAQLTAFVREHEPKMAKDCQNCIEEWRAPPPPREGLDRRPGQHNLPEYLDSDRERGLIIEKLLARIDTLEATIAKIESGKDGRDGSDGKDGKNGVDGQPGKNGENGKDAVIDYDKLLAELVKRFPKRRFILAKDGKIVDDELFAPDEAIVIDVSKIIRRPSK